MQYTAVVERRADGGFHASCPEMPGVTGDALARSDAVARLRDAIRYALEVCPCDTTTDDALTLVVVDAP